MIHVETNIGIRFGGYWVSIRNVGKQRDDIGFVVVLGVLSMDEIVGVSFELYVALKGLVGFGIGNRIAVVYCFIKFIHSEILVHNKTVLRGCSTSFSHIKPATQVDAAALVFGWHMVGVHHAVAFHLHVSGGVDIDAAAGFRGIIVDNLASLA